MGTLCLKALPKKGPHATACRWVLMYWSNSYRTSAEAGGGGGGGAGGQAADQVSAGMSVTRFVLMEMLRRGLRMDMGKGEGGSKTAPHPHPRFPRFASEKPVSDPDLNPGSGVGSRPW